MAAPSTASGRPPSGSGGGGGGGSSSSGGGAAGGGASSLSATAASFRTPASVFEMKGRFERAVPQELPGHRKKVQCLAFNRTGSHLATGGVEGTVRIWQTTANAATGLTAVSSSSSLELRGHEKELMKLCWNPASDHQLATCGRDRAVRLWDVRHKGHETHKVMTSGQADNIHIAWSPDGQTIAVGNDRDQVTFVDARKATTLKVKHFKYEVNEFAWAPSGSALLLGAGANFQGSFEVWTYPKMERAHVSMAHTGSIYTIQVDPTERHMAMGSQDGLVSIWDMADLVCLRTMDRFNADVTALGFSYDGRFLAAASEEAPHVDVTEVATGRQVALLRTDGGTAGVAWHPRALLLAWAGHGSPGAGGSAGGGGFGTFDDRSGAGGGGRRSKDEVVRFISVVDKA